VVQYIHETVLRLQQQILRINKIMKKKILLKCTHTHAHRERERERERFTGKTCNSKF